VRSRLKFADGRNVIRDIPEATPVIGEDFNIKRPMPVVVTTDRNENNVELTFTEVDSHGNWVYVQSYPESQDLMECIDVSIYE